MTYNKLSQDYTLRIQGNAYSASNSDAVTNQTSVNNIWENMEVSEAQEGAQPPKSQGKSYLLELFKKGISEKELKNVAKSFAQTISDVSIDKEGNLIISETPNEYGVFDITKYDKTGAIKEQKQKCNWNDNTYDFTQNAQGKVILKKDNIAYTFENMEKLKNKQYASYEEFDEKGSITAMKTTTYRPDGTLESETKSDFGANYNGAFYYDRNGNDSIRYYARPGEDKAFLIQTFDSSQPISHRYQYNDRGEVVGIIEFEKGNIQNRTDGDIIISNGKVDYQGNPNKSDGHVGSAVQTIGDCYFHSALNTVKQLNNGNKLLSNLIKYTPDGGVEITFPGASKLKGDWQTSYKISKKELDDIKANKKGNLSTGDLDVRLLEYGFEKLLKDWNKNFKTDIKLDSPWHQNIVIFLLLGNHYKNIFEVPCPMEINDNIETWTYSQDKESKNMKRVDYDNRTFPTAGKSLSELKKDPKYSTAAMTRKIEALEKLKQAQNSFSNNLAANISFNFDDGTSHTVAITEVHDKSVVLADSNYRRPIEMPLDYLLNIAKDITLLHQPKRDLMDYNVFENLYGNIPDETKAKFGNAPDQKLPKEFEKQNKNSAKMFDYKQ